MLRRRILVTTFSLRYSLNDTANFRSHLKSHRSYLEVMMLEPFNNAHRHLLLHCISMNSTIIMLGKNNKSPSVSLVHKNFICTYKR